MIRKFKAWLVKNHLTEDPADYVAVVDSNGNADMENIVAELVAEGMELKRETAIDVISRFNRKAIDLALAGYNVNTGLVYMRATIRGVFHDKKWDKERNKLRISITSGAELRKAVAETDVEILGEHTELCALFTIIDLSNGNNDGSVTPGFNAELRGSFIKIAGDKPDNGVTLRNIETGDERRLPGNHIAVNEPSKLMILIPGDLQSGKYELSVTTQFTKNNKSLKTQRNAILPTLIIVSE